MDDINDDDDDVVVVVVVAARGRDPRARWEVLDEPRRVWGDTPLCFIGSALRESKVGLWWGGGVMYLYG